MSTAEGSPSTRRRGPGPLQPSSPRSAVEPAGVISEVGGAL